MPVLFTEPVALCFRSPAELEAYIAELRKRARAAWPDAEPDLVCIVDRDTGRAYVPAEDLGRAMERIAELTRP